MKYAGLKEWFDNLKKVNKGNDSLVKELNKFNDMFDLKVLNPKQILDFKAFLNGIIDEKFGSITNVKLPKISLVAGTNKMELKRIVENVTIEPFKQEKARREAVDLVKNTVEGFKQHLQIKIMKQPCFDIPRADGKIWESTAIKPTKKQEKLRIRYEAILELDNMIANKDSLDDKDKQEIKKTLDICRNNKLGWSERPFFQQLTDVLSFGFKALYRTLISKEKELEKKVEQSLKPR